MIGVQMMVENGKCWLTYRQLYDSAWTISVCHLHTSNILHTAAMTELFVIGRLSYWTLS